MNLGSDLIDDARLLAGNSGDLTTALDRHRSLRHGAGAGLLATLLVTDRTLTAVDRAWGTADGPLPVTVINTSGAGGLTALASRSPQNLQIMAVDSALRDPADLAGNVARVAAAARELEADIAVQVEIPPGWGWQQAVAEAEAEGLFGVLPMTGPPDQVAGQLSAFVEADLAFVADRLSADHQSADRRAADLLPADRLVRLLLAVDAVIDGSSVADTATLLGAEQPDTTGLQDFDDARIGRIRRRLRRVRVADPATVIDRLVPQLLG